MERGPKPGPEFVSKITKDGTVTYVDWRPFTIGPSGKTAKHESKHIFVAGNIISATIIPSGEALGSTRPAKMTPEAAAAAAAGGHDGTSWDQFLTEVYMGVPFSQAKAGARARLNGNELETDAIAASLQRNGTIFQYDVEQALQLADKVRKGLATVVVMFIDKKGNKSEFFKETTQTADQIIGELEAHEEKELEQEKFNSVQNGQEHDIYSWSAKDQALFEAEVEKSDLVPSYIPATPEAGTKKRKEFDLVS